ncbi:MAG: MerR family transcriptional regulator [Reichenbachiella sp.]
MGKYSIKDLEKLSGVKAHTIRIWEKRYNLLTPNRSDTNIRSYNDEQLKKILNVSSLLGGGMKISIVASLTKPAFIEALNELNKTSIKDDNIESMLHQLIKQCIDFDVESLENLIKEIIKNRRMSSAFKEIFFPLLERVGHLWASNKLSPAHEHFLSNTLRQALFSATSDLKSTSKKKYLLFLPEWEQHELPLLFCHYMIRKAGHKSIYLGAKVPWLNLIETIDSIKPDYLLTSLISPNHVKEIALYLSHEVLPITYCSGHASYKNTILQNDNCHWIDNYDKLIL